MDNKILLTSSGFETINIQKAFIDILNCNIADAKVLFIPTAAIYPDAIMVLPKCLNDLLKIGVRQENITVYDLHVCMTLNEIKKYHAVYFTGGDPKYLLSRINDVGFASVLKKYVESGGIYVGVSAGSIIAANNMPDNLGFLKNKVYVHVETGTSSRQIDDESPISLSSNTAVLINGDSKKVIN